MGYDALVLAGGNIKGISVENVPAKGMLEINGKPMVEYTIDALKNCPQIERVVVIIPSSVSLGEWAKKADKVLTVDKSLTENIYAGMSYLKPNGLFLIISADVPLITSLAIEKFLKKCGKVEADLYYPIISRKEMDKKFIGTKRTYAHLKDGDFTGGNLGLIDSRVFEKNREFIEKLFSLRKSPFKLAKVLGFGFILKFLLGFAMISEAEEKLSTLIKAKGVAVLSDAETGIDVDKDADLVYVKEVICKRKG
ncbi:nucleotidyltransferase family protein [Candidatus Oleimmundimicrobium sp.]|uniref:nucleotidyltransferase family protein n=1 Tax=Candidatus Oleimmundimicrobium sp. TaxID=3060597 RepID=UPI0027254D6F|nr:nucleotidyltransferase family protein [Candidatus Oleimmundimicrobium sp.]MDO8886304.1 nucleotidyltransferase family protein [Candidatus Oleimmundimicrobium sp.]